MYHIVGSNESLVQTDFLKRRFIMTRPEQHHSKSIRLQALGALVTMFVVSVFAVNSAEGQAYTVIHNFAGVACRLVDTDPHPNLDYFRFADDPLGAGLELRGAAGGKGVVAS